MALLEEEFEKTGNILFRWRSYLPLFLFVLFFIAFRDFKYPFGSHRLDTVWEIFCLLVSFFGLGIRIFTKGYVLKGTSGRNTKEQIANSLNTTGMYSIVRHPLYLGNFFITLGISLFFRLWYISLLTILLFCLYYERIIFAEEAFLKNKFGKTYLIWANKTPTIFPKFSNWQSPNSKFSIKRIIKEEYHGFFGIIATFTFLEAISDLILEHRLKFDLMWTILFISGLIIYVSILILHKKTKVLEE